MPKYAVQVLASMTLDFTVEAADEKEALARMRGILEADHVNASDFKKTREIRKEFQTYCDNYGVDRLEITEHIEEAEDDAAPL